MGVRRRVVTAAGIDQRLREVDALFATGWTYFFQGIDGGPIKIGFTNGVDPTGRLAELQVGAPFELVIVGAIRGDQERELHREFSHLRLRGEWFTPGDDLIKFIVIEAQQWEGRRRPKDICAPRDGAVVRYLKRKDATAFIEPFFDGREQLIFSNDGDLSDGLGRIDWDGEDGLSDDEFEALSEDEYAEWMETSHYGLMTCSMRDVIEGEPFVQSVVVNESRGRVMFCCGECTSQRRWAIICDLALLAYEHDLISARWEFRGLMKTKGQLVCLDLIRLGLAIATHGDACPGDGAIKFAMLADADRDSWYSSPAPAIANE